jgi:polar amino acid transport system substrate-binding protein
MCRKIKIIFAIFLFLHTADAWAQEYPKELHFCFGNFKPYEYMQGDTAKGINVEIVDAIAKKFGIKMKWDAWPWARCVNLAKNGDVDGLMSLYKSTERENYFYYPEENINVDECVFFTYPGSHVTFDGRLQSLAGKKVLIARSNAYGQAFDEALDVIKIVAPNSVNVVRMIAGRRYKIGIGSRKTVEAEIRKQGYEKKVLILEHPYLIKTYFAFSKKKGPLFESLAEDFSNSLKAFKTTKQYKRILTERRW